MLYERVRFTEHILHPTLTFQVDAYSARRYDLMFRPDCRNDTYVTIV